MYKQEVEVLNEQQNVFTRKPKVNIISSENGSIKLDSTGNKFLDDFASLSKYKELRDPDDIFKTMETLWNIDPLKALKETFYLRIISRQAKYLDGSKTERKQIGTGLKHEFIYRLLWIANYKSGVFIRNLYLVPVVGSWYDVFQLLREYYSHTDNGHLPLSVMLDFIIDGLNNPEVSDLVKKYLPTLKSKSNCTTVRNMANNLIARAIMKRMRISVIEYRHLKASGKAHQWQQALSRGEKIDFSTIAGRALSKLVKSSFLNNQNLKEDFNEWIKEQPVVKFTGYPYEIFYFVNEDYQRTLINKQFLGLIEGKKLDSNIICVLDTSGSMGSTARGTNRCSLDIAKSMALYFSYFLKGKFNKTWLEFNDTCKIHTLKGNTPYGQYMSMNSNYYGSTNFLSVAQEFAKLKLTNAEEDFPTGILCLSDGEFNSYSGQFTTNFHKFKRILRSAGFSEEFIKNFKIILWDIPNSFYRSDTISKFESLTNEENFFYMSGFDPAGISFLFGTKESPKVPKTAEELFETAMNQEVLNKLSL